MRILIVEDEIKIKRGLANLIAKQTSHEIVGEAKNGQEGLEWVLKAHPDLVITDIKMPIMNGLEMIQKLYERNIKVHCVILSGYSEFDYAKQAIKYGVDDYLLKPLAPEDIMKLLESVEKKLQQEIKNQNDAAQRTLWKLLHESAERTDTIEIKKELGLKGDTAYTLLSGYGWNTMFEERREMMDRLVAVRNRLGRKDIQLLLLEEKKEIVCIVPEEEREWLYQEMEWTFFKNQKKWVWAESRITEPFDFNKVYEANRNLYLYSMLLGTKTVIREERAAKCPAEYLTYPEELESKLKASIYHQNTEQIKKYGQAFSEYLTKQNYEPKRVKSAYEKMVHHILVSLENSEKAVYEQIEALDYANKIRGCYTLEEMDLVFHELCETICSHIGSREDISNYAIKRAISYIRMNYRENIMLEDLANQLDITPEYLSTLFNREIGVNFSTFLKDFRISHAKRLLKGTDKKIYEIAEEVGYQDSKYFNRVFKEKVGISPREYRQL